MNTLFAAAAECLAADDPDRKSELTRTSAEQWAAGALAFDLASAGAPEPIGEPGRPVRPRLVHPRDLPKRSLASAEGYAAFLHALAHIEFNAINLAWDAVYRFRNFPRAYYDDWVRIAAEESYHFGLLRDHLRNLGYDYGDFDAHNGLWDMAVKTADDPLPRLAVVPRGLEARGLDVTPAMIDKVRANGDERAAEILGIILRDEIGHVEAGTRWFRHLCEERDLEPETAFETIVREHMSGRVRGALNREARRSAGFSERELAFLDDLQQGGKP